MLVLVGLLACKKSTAIAELTQLDGPVDRQAEVATAAWLPSVPTGTKFFLGDAARTHDAGATLLIGGANGSRLRMQERTVLRFGGKPGANQILVEVGAVDLTGSGNYALDVGDVHLLDGGTVRISAKDGGKQMVELTVGIAQVIAGGQRFDLSIGKPVDLGAGTVTPVAIDAGVVDAPPLAPPVDAAPPVEASSDATIEVTGKRAEIQRAGSPAWQPLPEGGGAFAKGSAVRLGAGTTARLTASGTTLELAGGARARLDDALALSLEAGAAQARTTAGAEVRLPGGAIAIAGPTSGDTAAREVRLDVSPRDSKVTIVRGGGKLTGAPGAELAMSRGETATLTRAGAIRIVEAIPNYFDLRVTVGESFSIHDPKPPTAVQLGFDGKCGDGGGIIEVDHDARFRSAKVSAGRDFANMSLAAGSWAYRLRCSSNGGEGAAVASGRIAVLRDDGRRPLPPTSSTNTITANGRDYTISYQSSIPNVVVTVANPGAVNKLHLASGGQEKVFDSPTSAFTVAGSQLHEGKYTYWLERDGVKQDKISTLEIEFDQTAPQVYIESPNNGQAWSGEIPVSGAVLPGWSAAVESVALSVDKQRRFKADVGTPAGRALAIRLAHPQRGVHYYLRRSN